MKSRKAGLIAGVLALLLLLGVGGLLHHGVSVGSVRVVVSSLDKWTFGVQDNVLELSPGKPPLHPIVISAGRLCLRIERPWILSRGVGRQHGYGVRIVK
jgi:hypothetical protein